MMNKCSLALAQWDLAVNLSVLSDEREAMHAVAQALESGFEDSGCTVLLQQGTHAILETTGHYSRLTQAAALDVPFIHETGISIYLEPVMDGQGRMGKLVLVMKQADYMHAEPDTALRQIALVLAATLRRIESAKNLHTSIRDHDLLQREVRHRIRNSLQLIKRTVPFLVGMEAKISSQASRDLDSRLCALASIHELLGWTGSNVPVSAENYFLQLSESLGRITVNGLGTLIIHYDGDVDVELSSDRAATMGLIVNELVMNTVKHAKPMSVRMDLRVHLAGNLLILSYKESHEASLYEVGKESFPTARDAGGNGLSLIKELLIRGKGIRVQDTGDFLRFEAHFPLETRPFTKLSRPVPRLS